VNTTGNTILITGGGTGIGRRLAEAFKALGNQVVIAGRRPQKLDGIASFTLDVADAGQIRPFAERMAAEFPTLNVLINNAGIMRVEKLQSQPEGLADAEAIVATYLISGRKSALLDLKGLDLADEMMHPGSWNIWNRSAAKN
jgi:uncharacterized oxidoreductase